MYSENSLIRGPPLKAARPKRDAPSLKGQPRDGADEGAPDRVWEGGPKRAQRFPFAGCDPYPSFVLSDFHPFPFSGSFKGLMWNSAVFFLRPTILSGWTGSFS